MNGVICFESDDSEYVEVDPTRRYRRYNEILGKGASKTVYRGFDEYEGIEVAWNQVKLYDFLQNPNDLERLYCEIHLLKTLKHKNIMKFYTSWVDTTKMNINFVTEMFTSGTLKQYRMKHRRVNIKTVKNWCRQILKGLLFLHTRDPPIIHRDLKCDNIFINGNQGEVKIGDLGLAAILRKSHAASCVGTPEFMAPEVYAEEYNELVDIYAFGMCILEMVTFEYPYSECTHPAQIYKKVMSGKKPDALYRVKDPEVRRFVEKCLASVTNRLSAKELLDDPFLLHNDDYVSDFRSLGPRLGLVNGGLDCYPVYCEAEELDLFGCKEDDHLENVDIAIKGRRREGEDDGIFLRLRIADKEGRVRNIYFPFDIQNDTALSVASEMVAELDITDQDVTKIADMIDGEISSLVPEWTRGFVIGKSLEHDYNIASETLSKNLQVVQCSQQGFGGRFEEIMYQFDSSEQYTDIWAQRDAPKLTSEYSSETETSDYSVSSNNKVKKGSRRGHFRSASAAPAYADDYENEIRRELRLLKAKYQQQLGEVKDQQLRSPERNFLTPCISFASGKSGNYEQVENSCSSPEHSMMNTAKCFYTKTLLPHALHRTVSLPDF